jgi:hypothetical protein
MPPVSGRRWGIGLVTVLAALGTAFFTLVAFIMVIYELCDTGQHAPGSTADTICDSGGGNVVLVAYLVAPTLIVLVGGLVGIKSQRWRYFWWGVALGWVVLVVAGLVLGNVPTTA